MVIITRYLFREIIATLLALTILLVLIYISHRFMFYLVQAAAGQIPAEFILSLLGIKLLSDMMIILPLSFFLAILLALGRMYKDNEITALAACGIAVPQHSILFLGLILSLIVGSLSLFLAPWAETQMDILRQNAKTVAELQTFTAGEFKEYQRGQGVFYAQSIDADSKYMQNIFLQLDLRQKRVLIVAAQAKQTYNQHGQLVLLLEHGYRYERSHAALDYVITQFEQHSLHIPSNFANIGRDHKSLSSVELWQSEQTLHQAELHWRLGLPIAVILLSALAVPISRTTPRQGQYAKIFAALLIYLLYQNLLNLGQKWLEQENIPLWLGLWWVHGIILIVVLFLTYLPALKLWWWLRQQETANAEIKVGHEKFKLGQKEVIIGKTKFKITSGSTPK